MNTVMYTIVTIDTEGRQLTGSGYVTFESMVRHVAERLRTKSYVRFLIIETINNSGDVTTGAYDWDRAKAEQIVRGA